MCDVVCKEKGVPCISRILVSKARRRRPCYKQRNLFWIACEPFQIITSKKKDAGDYPYVYQRPQNGF